MLATSEETMDRVVHQCGFGSVAALRHRFAERAGTSPRAYRYTFCGTDNATALAGVTG
jgi:transcriptional regulator GlxA family with amidase domain